MIEVKTQAHLDKVLKSDSNAEVRLVSGSFSLVLRGVAAPVLIVMGAATLDIEARESSAPHVVARESSAPRVVARGFTLLSVQGRVCGTASANVAVRIDGPANISGGHQITVRRTTAEEWCDYHGVNVVDGVATLFKGVKANFKSEHGGDYTPGNVPSVPVFMAEPECAAGALYFSPAPTHTHRFISEPAHYVACPVALADIVVHPNGEFPDKVKAKGCCGPVWECDENGQAVAVVL